MVQALIGQTFDPAFAAQGVLKYQVIADSRVSYEQNWFFKLMADKAGVWKLELHTKMLDPKFPLESTQFLTYDGTNVYSAVYSPQRVQTLPGSPPKLLPATHQEGVAQISTGPYPTDHSSVVGVIWLAFLGGEYLDAAKDSAKFPNLTVGNARIDPMAWSCDLKYVLTNTDAGVRSLISSGIYRLNPEYINKNSSGYPDLDEPQNAIEFSQLEDTLNQYRAVKTDNLVRAIYQLDEAKLINGLLVPVKFHCDVLPIESSDPTYHFEAVVTNLVSPNRVEIMPPLNGLVTVQDHRFRFRGKNQWRRDVFYNLTKSGWITDTNDPKLKAVLDKQPPHSKEVFSHTVVHYNLFRFIMGIFIIAPLIAMLIRHWQTKRKKYGSSNFIVGRG